MPDETGSRRLLVATGVTTDLPQSAGRLAESVSRMTTLFEDKFGYQRVSKLDLNPTAQEMRQGLRDFAKECGPNDYVAVYHTGHADLVAGTHRLWMGNTVDPVADALVTSQIAELMLAGTRVRNLLVILDTCFAGQGGTEVLLAGLKSAGNFGGKTMLAVTAAYPREQVRAGDFVELFERSVAHPATAGYEPRFLQLPAIVGHINADPERKQWQTVSYSTVLGTSEASFLPNPRFDVTFHQLDVATQLQREQDEQRRQDLTEFFSPRARGVDVPAEPGWNFVGRHAALGDLTAWLKDKGDSRSVIVTGDPGSGKSAVIARLAILSHPDWAASVPRQGIPSDTIPPPGAIDVTIHARNRTSDEVLQALCAAARIQAATPGEFLRTRAGTPMVAAVDAIDEALDPERLVTAVLNPLLEAGPPTGFRLLLGTRSYLLDRLNQRATVMDLDDERYGDPDSLRDYAERRLRAPAGSPYRTAGPALVRAVADAVAAAAGRSFLVALIACRTLAAVGRLADPADPVWRASLPATAAEAMEQDLVTRLGGEAARARDLLRPLAYALGRGLPWEDIWAPLASTLADREYRDDDLMWLRRNAGSYVVEALESGRSVYRLYHAALAEYLRQGQDEKRVNRLFLAHLLGHVPWAEGGERFWPDAHPYVLAHLATHAAACGELASIVSDPCYLACAAPAGLFAAFTAARDAAPQETVVAYERAMHRLRDPSLASRLSYLEFAAWRANARQLAERIAAYPVRRPWSVRWSRWSADHPHRVLSGHHGPVREVVCVTADDGTPQAVSVGDDGTLRLWDLASAEQVAQRQVTTSRLAAVDVIALADGRQLVVTLSSDRTLSTFHLPSLEPELSFSVYTGVRGLVGMVQLLTPELRCVELPDGRWAAVTAGPATETALWDLRTGARITKLTAGISPASVHIQPEPGGGWSMTGRHVLSPETEPADLSFGATPADLSFGATPADLSLSATLGLIFGGRDEAAQDEPSPGESYLQTQNRPKHAPTSGGLGLQVFLEGYVIKLVPVDGAAGDRAPLVLTGHGGVVTDADLAEFPDGSNVLVSSGADGNLRLWDIGAETDPLRSDATDDPSAVVVSTWAAADQVVGVVVSAQSSDRATVVDLSSGELLSELSNPGYRIIGGAAGWLPGTGPSVITFESGDRAQIWQLPNGKRAAVLRTGVSAEQTVTEQLPMRSAYVPLPGRPLVVTCGHGNRAIVWDLVGRRIHDVLGKHSALVSSVNCVPRPNGTPVVATAGHDNRVNLWDVTGGRRMGRLRLTDTVTRLRQPESAVPQQLVLALSDQRQLTVLVLCEDGRLRVFRKRRRRPGYKRVEIATNGASALAVLRLSSGRLIALTDSQDGQLCVWDATAALAGQPAAAEPLMTIEMETSVTSISTAGEGTVIVATLNGLAAFRLDTALLDGTGYDQSSSPETRLNPVPVTSR